MGTLILMSPRAAQTAAVSVAGFPRVSRVTAKTGRRSSLEPRKGMVREPCPQVVASPAHSEASSQMSTRPPRTVVSSCSGFSALGQCTEESQWYGMAACCGWSISHPWRRGLGRWDLIVVLGKKDWPPGLCSEPTWRVTGHCQFTPLPLKTQADRFLRWKLRKMTGSFFSLGFRAEFFFQRLCFLSLSLLPSPPEASSQRGQAEPECRPPGWGTLGLCSCVWKGKFETADYWPVSPQTS